MTPEEQARQVIDQQLAEAGWIIQDYSQLNLGAGIGILADSLQRPPLYLTTNKLWAAYEKLEASRVKKAGTQKLLTDIISLVRFAIGETETLESYSLEVETKFQRWLRGKSFSPKQLQWLERIKDLIASSVRAARETRRVKSLVWQRLQQKEKRQDTL